MPRKYLKKQGVPSRATWTEDALSEAVKRYRAGEIGLREAERIYRIPTRTLTRRMASGNLKKGSLGPQGVLNQENEKRLVAHIQRLGRAGFAPDRQSVRRLAYEFAVKLGVKHNFCDDKKMAGYAWLASFLERNPDLAVRQAEGLSIARARGMNREDTANFFNLLEDLLMKENLMDKPQNIFNMDESGIHLINKPGKVLTSKGAKDTHVLTPRERGENVTVIACNNAEGMFLPPVLIMKGVNNKKEFVDGLPHGSEVYMNPKSSYINSELFLRWFREHFLPRKSPGRNILILDGHTSHYNAFDMLQLAESNNVTILCLPSHTTQALQPLDRSFFGPLKSYFNQEAKTWMQHHKGRAITRYQAGYLIGKAWNKAASVGNGVSGFKATGIFPLNPEAIPEHFYSISDASADASTSTVVSASTNVPPVPSPSSAASVSNSSAGSTSRAKSSAVPVPSTSSRGRTSAVPAASISATPDPCSPSKHLHEVSPVPILTATRSNRKRQSAEVLTSPDHLEKCKRLQEKRKRKGNHSAKRQAKRKRLVEDSDNSDVSSPEASDTSRKDVDSNNCSECWENYYTTKEKADWIRCQVCCRWLHESCTLYGTMCSDCGREKKRQEVTKRKKSK